MKMQTEKILLAAVIVIIISPNDQHFFNIKGGSRSLPSSLKWTQPSGHTYMEHYKSEECKKWIHFHKQAIGL